MAGSATSEISLADRYPRAFTVSDELLTTLRLMEPKDIDGMVRFARALPADDLLFLRRNITERAAVEGWVANIEAGQAVCVLAFGGNDIAGYASLNLNLATWMHHLGEIRLLTGTEYRGIGLGRILAAEIFAVARSFGLRKLSAQMTVDQSGARAIFERLGFRPEALLTDWVMDANGRTRDLLVMALDLDGLSDTVDG